MKKRIITFLLILLFFLPLVESQLHVPGFTFPSSPIQTTTIPPEIFTAPFDPEENTGIIAEATEPIETANGIIDNIAGEDLLIYQDQLLEGEITSTVDDNFFAAYDIAGDSIVAFSLDRGEQAIITQFENGQFQDSFKTTLSTGARLTQHFRDRDATVTFDATSPASFIIDQFGTYTIGNGVFTYTNKNIQEKVRTDRPTRFTFTKTEGIICVTLSKGASYQYTNLDNPSDSFIITATKDAYDFCKGIGTNYFTPDTLFLTDIVELHVNRSLIYTSLSSANRVMFMRDVDGITSASIAAIRTATFHSGPFLITYRDDKVFFSYTDFIPFVYARIVSETIPIVIHTTLHTLTATQGISTVTAFSSV